MARPFARFRLPFRVKIAAVTSVIFLALLGSSLYFFYRLSTRRVIEEFGQKLISVAVSGAMDVDGSAFAALSRKEQMGSAPYRAVRARLFRLKAANAHIKLRYVYTMALTPKPGIWRYVVDSEPENSPQFSVLGSTEDFTYDPLWLKPLEKPVTEDLQYFPGWGYVISASAPIRDKVGRSVGILGVDANADALWETLRDFRRRALLFVALGLALCILVSFPLAWHVTRPLSDLMGGTLQVASGHFDFRVPIRSNDEAGALAQAFNLMAQGLKERELYRQQFGRYVSHQIAEKILANPEKEFWDAERRRATILFSDIRGFTAMSERIPPEEVISRLNEYLTLMIDIVFAHEGTLDKFIGDAVMALFGAPMSLGNDEERAVRTAVAMQRASDELSLRWAKDGYPEFKIGIGIHTGDVVVGNVGSHRRMEYSAIGDAVNLASRLESLNKDYNTRTLISADTYASVQKLVEARFVDNVAVRGRTQPIAIYEVLGLRGA